MFMLQRPTNYRHALSSNENLLRAAKDRLRRPIDDHTNSTHQEQKSQTYILTEKQVDINTTNTEETSEHVRASLTQVP
jgi:hypothetical protein